MVEEALSVSEDAFLWLKTRVMLLDEENVVGKSSSA